MKTKTLLLNIILLVIVLSCDEITIDKNEKLNNFELILDGQPWSPSIIEKDTCQQAFYCTESSINGSVFYTIYAYRDSNSIGNYRSDNYFRLQIMDVNHIGTYQISDKYGDFTSYARFIDNSSGFRKIYDNHMHRSPTVEIQELIPVERGSWTGIRGRFSGTLFNTENQSDSIVIKDCEFLFRKLNFRTFNQCSNE